MDETIATGRNDPPRALFEGIDDAVVVHDRDGRIVDANGAACRRLGYAREDLLRLTTRDVNDPACPALAFAGALDDAAPRAQTREGQLVTRDGGRLRVEVVSAVVEVDGRRAVLSSARDVTARRAAEQERGRGSAFLDSILENVPIMLFVKEAEGLRFERFNRAAELLLGYRREDLLGKSDHDFFPPEQAEFFITKDRRVLASGELLDIPEEHIQTRNGPKVLHTKKIPILDEDGRPRYLLGISEDITERKALEETRRQFTAAQAAHAHALEEKNEALLRSERRYRQLTESSLDAIVVADEAGVIVLFNPAAERAFGYTAAEAVGQALGLLVPSDLSEGLLRRYLETGQSDVVGRTVELAGRRKDGAAFPIEIALSAVRLGAETQFMAAIRDLTERNRMRSLVVRTEKLAAIGMLSAGMAHEINNPIAFVRNNLVVLERDLAGVMAIVNVYESAREALAAVAPEAARRVGELGDDLDLAYVRGSIGRVLARSREGVDRVARIVNGLRTMAYNGPATMEEARVGGLVGSCVEMSDAQLRRSGARVTVDCADALTVRCVPTQLSQVLINLLVNAAHAIESGARGDGLIEVTSRRRGGEVLIEVRDNGCGIADDVLPHLFDPFFTTKPVGKGMGLGLSISHGIIAGHGGRIEVTSGSDGTRFQVFLPTGTTAVQPPAPRPAISPGSDP